MAYPYDDPNIKTLQALSQQNMNSLPSFNGKGAAVAQPSITSPAVDPNFQAQTSAIPTNKQVAQPQLTLRDTALNSLNQAYQYNPRLPSSRAVLYGQQSGPSFATPAPAAAPVAPVTQTPATPTGSTIDLQKQAADLGVSLEQFKTMTLAQIAERQKQLDDQLKATQTGPKATTVTQPAAPNPSINNVLGQNNGPQPATPTLSNLSAVYRQGNQFSDKPFTSPAPGPDNRPATVSWQQLQAMAGNDQLTRLQNNFNAAQNLAIQNGQPAASVNRSNDFEGMVANRLGYVSNGDGTYRKSAPALADIVRGGSTSIAPKPSNGQGNDLTEANRINELADKMRQDRLIQALPPAQQATSLAELARERQSAIEHQKNRDAAAEEGRLNRAEQATRDSARASAEREKVAQEQEQARQQEVLRAAIEDTKNPLNEGKYPTAAKTMELQAWMNLPKSIREGLKPGQTITLSDGQKWGWAVGGLPERLQ